MTLHESWFIPRQKRQLTLLVEYVTALQEMVVGKIWSGNHSLQQAYEDRIIALRLRQAGQLRARNENAGGGGIRTTFAQLKALGLLFEETQTKIVRLTYAGEALINGSQTFVDVIRHQLLRFQYPSSQFFKGNSAVSSRFCVHPFWFLLKLLSDDRIGNYLNVDEIKYIVIVMASNDSRECYEKVVSLIKDFRENGVDALEYTLEEFGQVVHYRANGSISSDKFYDIANTFLAYLDATQYIERYDGKVWICESHRDEVRNVVENSQSFIGHPELPENYLRRYGCDIFHSSDRRQFRDSSESSAEQKRRKIINSFVLESLNTPIKEIDVAIINKVSMITGFHFDEVENVLRNVFPNGNLEGFLCRYREMAFAGREESTEFEIATVELFREVFGFETRHVGPIGNTPDVYVKSNIDGYGGIIDNKAYSAYSVNGDHKRRMVYEYIPRFADESYPLSWFSYIAGGFGRNIDNQIRDISDTSQSNGFDIKGCAITVDLILTMVRKQESNPYSHERLRNIFTLNRRVRLEDIF